MDTVNDAYFPLSFGDIVDGIGVTDEKLLAKQ